jgi:hypothetical protein
MPDLPRVDARTIAYRFADMLLINVRVQAHHRYHYPRRSLRVPTSGFICPKERESSRPGGQPGTLEAVEGAALLLGFGKFQLCCCGV